MSAKASNGETKVDLANMKVLAEGDAVRAKYANFVRVVSSDHETTLDFVYLDAMSVASGDPTGYLVSRVALSHSNLEPLRQALQGQIDSIASRENPKPRADGKH